jgi:hypothetical protein
MYFQRKMDHRVKPGDDDYAVLRRCFHGTAQNACGIRVDRNYFQA